MPTSDDIIDEALFEYVRENIRKGYNKNQIKKACLDTGYSNEEIRKVMNRISYLNEYDSRQFESIKSSAYGILIAIIFIVLISYITNPLEQRFPLIFDYFEFLYYAVLIAAYLGLVTLIMGEQHYTNSQILRFITAVVESFTSLAINQHSDKKAITFMINVIRLVIVLGLIIIIKNFLLPA